jgi:hypothetical protein
VISCNLLPKVAKNMAKAIATLGVMDGKWDLMVFVVTVWLQSPKIDLFERMQTIARVILVPWYIYEHTSC